MIRFAVSSVVSRHEAAQDLLAALPGDTRVYVDEPPSGSSWPNYRRALLGAGVDGPCWLVCLDDDAHLCEGFTGQIAAALAHCPGSFATFYLDNRHLVAAARTAGASWVATLRVVHGVCWAVRSELAAEAVDVAERLVRPSFRSGDQRLQAWLAATGRVNYASVPSLVDHRAELPSVMWQAPERRPRRATWFGAPAGWTFSAYHDDLDPLSALRRLAQRAALTVPYDKVL